MTTTNNFKEDKDEEIEAMLALLRQVYDVIEMSHLNDHKMISDYCAFPGFKKSLGRRIFGYLQSKDQTFRDKVISRQNRYRRFEKSGGLRLFYSAKEINDPMSSY